MAIPTHEEILAVLQGQKPSVPSHDTILKYLPKPQITNSIQSTMGSKSFADYKVQTRVPSTLPPLRTTETDKEEMLSLTPFTEAAKDIISNKNRYSYVNDLPSDIGGETELPDFRTGNKAPTTKIDLNWDQHPAVFAHETFQSLFNRSNIDPASFNATWEKAKKNNPDMQELDDYFSNPAMKNVFHGGGEEVDTNEYARATERYSLMGSLWGYEGLSSIPEELKSFYSQYLTDKSIGFDFSEKPATTPDFPLVYVDKNAPADIQEGLRRVQQAQMNAQKPAPPFRSTNKMQTSTPAMNLGETGPTGKPLPFAATPFGILTHTVLGLQPAAFEVTKDIAQGTARIGAQAGLTVMQATGAGLDKLTGQSRLPSMMMDIPTNGFEWLFGDKPLQSYATILENVSNDIMNSPLAKRLGVADSKSAYPLAFAGVLGWDALNFLGGESALKAAAKNLAPIKDARGVKDVLKRTFKFSEEMADLFSGEIAKETDPAKIMTLLTLGKGANTIKLMPKLAGPVVKGAVADEKTIADAARVAEQLGIKEQPKSTFVTPPLRELSIAEKELVPIVNEVISGERSVAKIGDIPGFVSEDGATRSLVFSKEIASKIARDHGEMVPENLIINANDWKYVKKNVGGNPDKINLIKPTKDEGFIRIAANRDDGFFIVTHYENVPGESQKLKNLLRGADVLDRNGRTLPPVDTGFPPSATSPKGAAGQPMRLSGVESNITTGRSDVPSLDISPVESEISTAQRAMTPDGTPLGPKDFLAAPPAQGRSEGVLGRGDSGTTISKEGDVSMKAKNAQTNLIKSLSAENKPIAVTEILKDSFPKAGQEILDVFSKRLAGLKRESDIEAIVNTLRRLYTKTDEAGHKVMNDTTPVSIQQVLSKKQTQLNIDLLTRELGKTDEEGRKLSAATQNEYDRLWEEADQKVIDRFNELNIERDILDEVITDHPGKFFTQFRLPGQSWDDFRLDEALVRGMKTGGKNKNIDIYLSEHGYESLEAAQKGMEDFLAMKKRVKELTKDIRELHGRVKAAQLVRGILDSVPIIPNKAAAEIDTLVDSATVRDFTDISGTMGQARDLDRNFERFFGRYYPQFKKVFLDPFDDAKRALTNGIREKRDALKAAVTDKFKINRSSEESKAIQDWGERELMNDPATANPDSVYQDEEVLIKRFGETRAREIQKLADWFRPVYDKGISEANDVFRKIYPKDASKLIPYRKDFFHHFQDLGDGFVDAIRSFMDVPSGIDPKLVGLSEFTKPKEKFKAFAQIRKGPQAKRDAIEGYLRFMEGVEYLKHIEPHISNFRYLRRKIAEVAPRSGTMEEGIKQKGVDNFLQFLDDFANDLAGKTAAADRFIQKVIPGGRATMRTLEFFTNRIKANTMLGNMGTSLAQLANVPLTIAETKQHAAEGIGRTVASLFDAEAPARNSTFLNERFQKSYKSEFPIDFANHPLKRTEEEGAKVLAWMLRGGDRLGVEFSWNSFLSKYLSENRKFRDGAEIWSAGTSYADAMRYADNETRRLVAGRGIGELPLLQKSRIAQMTMPFTVEANNAWYRLGDNVRRKAFGTIATYLLLNFLYNEVMERTRGSRVTYDPINALWEGSETFMREAKKGNYGRGTAEFAGRQAGEVLSNIGGGQVLSSMLPATLGGVKKTDIFGQGDPNRFGPPLLLAGALQDPQSFLFRAAGPFGGVQAQKTYKGVQALLDEQVRNRSGKTSFPIANTPENITRAMLFGPYGTKEAHDAFATGDKLDQGLAIQNAERAQQSAEAESIWSDLKSLRQKKGAGAAKERWDSLKKDDPELFAKVKKISDDEAKGITANDRKLLMFGVANGARAQYVADQINSLQTKEEKQKLWREYVTKKILTPEVARQTEELIQ